MPKCKKQCNERFSSFLQLRFDKYLKCLPARLSRFSFHLDISLAEECDLCTRLTNAQVVVIVHRDPVDVRIVGCISPGDCLRTRTSQAVHIKEDSVAACLVLPRCVAYDSAGSAEKEELVRERISSS